MTGPRSSWLLPLLGWGVLSAPAWAEPAAGPLCINTQQIVGREAHAPDRLTLTLTRHRRVDALLSEPCPHLVDLDRTYTLVFDRRDGDNLCRGDRFRVVDPKVAAAGGAVGYPYCRVSRFVTAPEAGAPKR